MVAEKVKIYPNFKSWIHTLKLDTRQYMQLASHILRHYVLSKIWLVLFIVKFYTVSVT